MNETTPVVVYQSRKPKWWYRRFGKASKGQRQAIVDMQDYQIQKPPYGQMIDWDTVFPFRRIGMEIGFGSGENLMALANKLLGTETVIIGAEVYKAGVGKLCQRLQHGNKHNKMWKGYTAYHPRYDPASSEFSGSYLEETEVANSWQEVEVMPPPLGEDASLYRHVRFYAGDVVKLFPQIPSSSIDFILITFPDPFPQKGEIKWRLVQKHTLTDMHRILKADGILYLATDHEGYFTWCTDIIAELNSESILFEALPSPSRSEWLPAISNYEAKGWREGRRTHLKCWKVVKA